MGGGDIYKGVVVMTTGVLKAVALLFCLDVYTLLTVSSVPQPIASNFYISFEFSLLQPPADSASE